MKLKELIKISLSFITVLLLAALTSCNGVVDPLVGKYLISFSNGSTEYAIVNTNNLNAGIRTISFEFHVPGRSEVLSTIVENGTFQISNTNIFPRDQGVFGCGLDCVCPDDGVFYVGSFSSVGSFTGTKFVFINCKLLGQLNFEGVKIVEKDRTVELSN